MEQLYIETMITIAEEQLRFGSKRVERKYGEKAVLKKDKFNPLDKPQLEEYIEELKKL